MPTNFGGHSPPYFLGQFAREHRTYSLGIIGVDNKTRQSILNVFC